eukprot:271466_1
MVCGVVRIMSSTFFKSLYVSWHQAQPIFALVFVYLMVVHSSFYLRYPYVMQYSHLSIVLFVLLRQRRMAYQKQYHSPIHLDSVMDLHPAIPLHLQLVMDDCYCLRCYCVLFVFFICLVKRCCVCEISKYHYLQQIGVVLSFALEYDSLLADDNA